MTHIVEAAALHGLLLWEDCAQVFTGLGGYLGHPDSDAAFFSFGVIKRATAFGGGIARIRDAQVLSGKSCPMLREEAEYPSQSAAAYLRRVLKCSLMLALTTPLLFGIILHTLAVLGIEHDEVVMKLSKGFPKKGLMRAIRHRASIPLLQMLAWRISRYPTEGVEIRLQHCNRMLSVLEAALSQRQRQPQPPRALPPRGGGAAREEPSALSVGEGEEGGGGVGVGDVLPGVKAYRHTLWLYPVMVTGGPDRASHVVRDLLREGFDATRAPTSLMPIERCTTTKYKGPPGGVSSSSPCRTPRCSAMMDSLVYLPLANNIPDSEVDRMALALARSLWSCGYSAAPGDGRLDSCGGPAGGPRKSGGNGSRERTALARSLVAFAFRLDVIAVSTLCLMVLAVSFVILAWLR
ncbi:unnamed protein product [Ectocarpus sp. 12 AP-2014]